jgi:hypothetical protein
MTDKKIHCGSFTVMGHGENAVCGEPYWDGIYQCPSCKCKDLEKQIAEMKANGPTPIQ